LGTARCLAAYALRAILCEGVTEVIMRRIALLFLFTLFLAGTVPLAAEGAQPLDQVRLKDGRVLSGQIVEEHSANIVLLVRGVRRSYDRNFIKHITYGSAPGIATSNAEGSAANGVGTPLGVSDADGSSVPAQPESGLTEALAQRYRVPLRDVLWVRAQGVGDAELPLVFLIAATAQVTTRQVMALYHKGWTWEEIEDYFQMQPNDITYEPGPWEDYPYYDAGLYVGWGWDGYGWGGYGYGGYGWAGRCNWRGGRGNWRGGRGDWGGGRGNWRGGRGNWGGGHGSWRGGRGNWGGSGGRTSVGAMRSGGSRSGGARSFGGFSGAGRASVGGGSHGGGRGGRR
ncbi:MAG: hypothetical protein ACREKE_08785, partial [bacterium]